MEVFFASFSTLSPPPNPSTKLIDFYIADVGVRVILSIEISETAILLKL